MFMMIFKRVLFTKKTVRGSRVHIVLALYRNRLIKSITSSGFTQCLLPDIPAFGLSASQLLFHTET